MSNENLPTTKLPLSDDATTTAVAPEYWQKYVTDIAKISRQVETEFGALTAEQLNWQQNPEKWSVAQCLEHLIKINSSYFPVFEQIINGNKKTTFLESFPFLAHFFGNILLKELDPQQAKKHKAVEQYLPAQSAISSDIVAQFVAHQEDLARYLQLLNAIDHHKTILTSPVASFVTYSLKDAVTIIVVHEQRHILQAQTVMQQNTFPKNMTNMLLTDLSLPKAAQDIPSLDRAFLHSETQSIDSAFLEGEDTSLENYLDYKTASLDVPPKN